MAEQWLSQRPGCEGLLWGLPGDQSQGRSRPRSGPLGRSGQARQQHREAPARVGRSPRSLAGEADTLPPSRPRRKRPSSDQILQTIRDKYQDRLRSGFDAQRARARWPRSCWTTAARSLDDMDQRFGMLAAAQQGGDRRGRRGVGLRGGGRDGQAAHDRRLREESHDPGGLWARQPAVWPASGQIAETSLAMAGTAMDANRLEEASRLAKLAHVRRPEGQELCPRSSRPAGSISRSRLSASRNPQARGASPFHETASRK
jgi:hypothetical protein